MISKENKNILIVLAGPTSVGKTSVSIELAKYFKSEIFSADSRQIYQELNIGTAKPSPHEQNGIVHHFIGNISISDEFNVKKYEENLISKLNNYFKTNQTAILTGGTGFYIQAALYGMDDIPDIPPEVTKEVENEFSVQGLEGLVSELLRSDPDVVNHINIKNPRRVIRALAIIRHTGRPFSSLRKGIIAHRNFTPIKIYLDRDREELYDRINRRVDQMLDKGLLNEVKSLADYFSLPSLQTVGYQEIISYLNGEIDYEEAVRLIKRNSRRYAKRQRTWFNNQDIFRKFHPDEIDKIKEYIENEIMNLRSEKL